MNKVLIVICALLGGCASQTPYFKVGASYKFDELEMTFHDGTGGKRKSDPIGARVEVGVEDESFNYGVSHHSQFLDGWPFNDKYEYHKTELFIDYVYKFR